MLIRRKLITTKAQELLHATKQVKPAIDAKKVADYLNILVKESPAPTDDISGFLMIEKDAPVIGLNINNSELRRRFTLGHELGHFVLQHHLGKGAPHIDKLISIQFRDSVSSAGVKIEEMEANLFAAELLMPSDMIARSLKNFESMNLADEDHGAIGELAEEYQVSVPAMTVRLSSLGYLRM